MKPIPIASVTRNIFSFLLVLISVSLAASEAMAADPAPKNETWPQYADRVYFDEFGEPFNKVFGPLFNAGEKAQESSKPLLKTLQDDPQASRRLARWRLGARAVTSPPDKGLKRVRQLASTIQKAGSVLEKAGKGANWHSISGNSLDNLGNVSAALGAASEGSGVGVGQAATNAGLSGLSAAAGAAAGSAGVGLVVAGPVGAAVGGVVGAIGGSYIYSAYGEPVVDKAAEAVSNELQRREELANKTIRRIQTDRALLEQNHRPAEETLAGIPVGFIPPAAALLIHQRAEAIRAQQTVERVEKNTADNIGDRVNLLNTLRLKTNDPEAREKLEREIALLELRLQNLPLADVNKRVDVLNSMRDKTDDPAARDKIDRELAFLNQRDRKTADAPTKPIEPTAVTTKTPPPPCAGPNEERNSAGVCVCRPGTEAVGGICRPYCAANMTRDGDGTCVCASGYEPLGGACVLKCQPNEERIGGVCLTRCGANEERSAQNICVCISGFVLTPKGCAQACGPNETRDEGGKCVCSAGFEPVGGECVPFCAQGEVRTEGGGCVKGYACGTDSDCPAGFSCSPAGTCVDNRPSGDAAVRMRTEVNQGQRNQTGRTQLPLYGQTTTTRPERFGLSQMPGGPTQVLTPLAGAGPTSPQQPQQTGTTSTSTTPSDIACGAGDQCPSGYTCNSRTGVCVKQAQASGPVTIPTCTTERDCPGAKCVNNVCTSAPATPAQPTKSTTVQPTQQTRQWYVLEAVAGFTVCDLGSTCTAAHKVPCTLTYWAAYGLMQSELQAALQGIGKDLMGLVGGYENARLISTRVYQGPSTTQLKTPVSGPPSKLDCGKK